jgi:3-oxoadipate enol-lactonase
MHSLMKKRRIGKALLIVVAILVGVKMYLEWDVYQYEKQLQSLKSDLEKASQRPIGEEHRVLALDGYNIHYYTTGDKNKAALLFLHPAFGDHRCFNQQVKDLSADYHVITVDLLGHGLSGVAEAEVKMDASADHIQQILEKEGHRNAHIAGVSMGSLVGQYFALNHPEKTLSLTVVGGYNIRREDKEVQKAQQGEMFKWLLKIILSMDSFRKYVATTAVSNPVNQARFYEMAQHYTRQSFSVMPGLDKMMQVRKDVKRAFPLSVMVGEYDIDLIKKHIAQWRAEDPKMAYYGIEKAGHCANMDQPEKFNQQLRAFLKSTEK